MGRWCVLVGSGEVVSVSRKWGDGVVLVGSGEMVCISRKW